MGASLQELLDVDSMPPQPCGFTKSSIPWYSHKSQTRSSVVIWLAKPDPPRVLASRFPEKTAQAPLGGINKVD